MDDHNVIRLANVEQGMADTKDSREDQADNEERRQREQELQEARDRADEAEPGKRLGDLDAALETHDYPTTLEAIITAYGDHRVETQSGWKSVDEVLDPVGNETYDSADEVRNRILRLIQRR